MLFPMNISQAHSRIASVAFQSIIISDKLNGVSKNVFVYFYDGACLAKNHPAVEVSIHLWNDPLRCSMTGKSAPRCKTSAFLSISFFLWQVNSLWKAEISGRQSHCLYNPNMTLQLLMR